MNILTNVEKQLILESFAQIAPDADEIAHIFYERLFEIEPNLESFFAETKMHEQERKLMQTLGALVGAVYNWADVVPQIKALGKRHIAYGVVLAQYQVVGNALIWTLQESLGADFTDEVYAAWAKMYESIIEIIGEVYQEKSVTTGQ